MSASYILQKTEKHVARPRVRHLGSAQLRPQLPDNAKGLKALLNVAKLICYNLAIAICSVH